MARMLQSRRPGHDTRREIDPRSHDASASLVRELGLSDADIEEIVDLFEAMRRWSSAADAQRAASRRSMRLGENDVRAIRFLMASGDRVVTSTELAEHLGLKGPSVTKLLDRLEAAGHIHREPHPSDRRALSIVVSPGTRALVSAAVGAEHARRLRVAATLSTEERRAVTRFLSAIAEDPDPGRDA